MQINLQNKIKEMSARISSLERKVYILGLALKDKAHGKRQKDSSKG